MTTLSDANGVAGTNKGAAVADARSATSQSPVSEKEKILIGTWLCEEGPYQEYIANLSGSNPGLSKADPNNHRHPLKPGNALVVLLDAASTGEVEFNRRDFKNASELRQHFAVNDNTHDRRRVYIMEGLAQDFVAIIGGHFFMEPTFFQRQERTCVWSNEFTPTSDALPQPSILDPDSAFHLQYCELRHFNKAIENKPYFCHRTRRHMGVTSTRPKEKSTTGILRRKISWWCRKTTNGGWDVVILCDPQLIELEPRPNEVLERDARMIPITNPDDLKNDPFQGGYIDFLPPASRERASLKPRHPHGSMLKNLVHYFENHADLLDENDWEDPVTSSLFLKKIVAAHYLQLVDYIKAMLPSLELRLTTAWVEEQGQWKSLQTISRRCGNYSDDIEDTLVSLGYPLEVLHRKGRPEWKDCQKDFQYIYFRLKILKERADTLMGAMTGLASIAGNRQNLEEAKRVKRLNLLALLFIPLAYTSSLFSMQDNFAPGNGKFWVYWVSALSVVALTLITTWVLDSALNDEAQWTVPYKQMFKRLGFRSNEDESGPQRAGTGFYK
ncbi:hypothetical protein BDV95DRAFT_478531 [Massariosphaeria phaeospora]|uniref:Cora-like Mg2+ transporter protein-domain-containing protein n=1 Tax=Massariosphaeria phaeospora TaxID=100035 RepID=A0A7C8MK02_9PLEO|nr:hypothetical protein BDV95DRAFT_478531 [Massariosphaeria phaeospora]